VGSIYTNATNNTNPGTLLGFGTWTAFGATRVLAGYDATNPLFNAAEFQNGYTDSIVVDHTHTATTTLSNTTHTHSGTTASAGAHTHNFASTGLFASSNDPDPPLDRIVADSGAGSAPTATLQGITYLTTVAAHTHTITTGNNSATPTGATTITNAGVTGVNKNYQPYIVVYMWKRTA
jgi:hypothetical protein